MRKLVEDLKLRQEIMEKVQSVLDKYQPRKYAMHVTEVLIDDTNWFHIVVESNEHKRDNEFYDALTYTEDELASADPDHEYLLVPLIAD